MTADDQSGWNARKHHCDLTPGRRVAFVERQGHGPPVLLIHGFTDSSRSFSPLQHFLPGLRLSIPDLVGHGSSSHPDNGYDLDTRANDMARFITAVHGGPVVITGHSLGAMIALRLAATRPELARALVLISGTLRPRLARQAGLSRWIGGLQDPIDPADPRFDHWHACATSVERSFLHHMRSEAAAIPARIWKSVFAAMEDIDLAPDAERQSLPVLTIAGGEDLLFDPTHREAFNRALGRKQHEVISQCGHNPHWEAPRAIGSLISAFIAGHSTV